MNGNPRRGAISESSTGFPPTNALNAYTGKPASKNTGNPTQDIFQQQIQELQAKALDEVQVNMEAGGIGTSRVSQQSLEVTLRDTLISRASSTLEPRFLGTQSTNASTEVASTMKMSGISFDGDVRKVTPMWFLQRFEEVANLAHQSDVQKRALLRSVIRGTASQ